MPKIYPNSNFWVCKNGRQIRYQDMTNEHLSNVINFMNAKIAYFVNKCMSENEELEPPFWVQEALIALNDEQQRRLKEQN